jgi:hypothetical protein
MNPRPLPTRLTRCACGHVYGQHTQDSDYHSCGVLTCVCEVFRPVAEDGARPQADWRELYAAVPLHEKLEDVRAIADFHANPVLLEWLERRGAEAAKLEDVVHAVVKLLHWLATWSPEMKPGWTTANTHGMYQKGDELNPFLSESYLYNLIGKEDARSILSEFRLLVDALKAAGIDPPLDL